MDNITNSYIRPLPPTSLFYFFRFSLDLFQMVTMEFLCPKRAKLISLGCDCNQGITMVIKGGWFWLGDNHPRWQDNFINEGQVCCFWAATHHDN